MNPLAIIAVIKIKLLRRPLWELETVSDCLDIPKDKLMAMIDSGELAWTWNIGLGTTRRDLRVLAHSVVERQMGPIGGIGKTANLSLPQVLNLFLPEKSDVLRATELQRILNTTPDQIRKFWQAKEIEMVPEKRPRTGPNASPHYTRASLVRFFDRRRVK